MARRLVVAETDEGVFWEGKRNTEDIERVSIYSESPPFLISFKRKKKRRKENEKEASSGTRVGLTS